MKKLTLLVDLDAIIVDLTRPWLAWYNGIWNDNMTVESLTSYNIERLVKPECGMKIFDFFEDPRRYLHCPILPGAAEGLRTLHDAGHDIVIATATAGETANCKRHLATRAAPWLPWNAIMIGSRKELLRGDVFIDDAPKNLTKYKAAWPEARLMTIAYPYNRELAGVVDVYAEGYNDTFNAWDEIAMAILAYGEMK